jgi:hypothetical protein
MSRLEGRRRCDDVGRRVGVRGGDDIIVVGMRLCGYAVMQVPGAWHVQAPGESWERRCGSFGGGAEVDAVYMYCVFCLRGARFV